VNDLAKIEELCHAALQIPADKREYFLRQSCGDDVELLREVQSLLSFEAQAASFIETPPEDIAATFFSEEKQPGLAGKTLHQYQILAPLGKGGMGEVYLAEDTKLGRKVAIKILPPQFAQETDRKIRFEKEARAISALNHPNIITIFGVEEAENLNFIATEFIAGKTLRERLEERLFSPPEAVEICIQAANALESAHSVGIVHRDPPTL
jgi:eukaryotic-like serine/threonine-protein kinase